jgi:hypothetical protein
MVLQDPSIKGPSTPPPSPFRPPARDAAKTEEFLVGPPRVCKHRRSISTLSVSSAPSLLSYHLCLTLTPSLDPMSRLESPQIDAANPSRSSLPLQSPLLVALARLQARRRHHRLRHPLPRIVVNFITTGDPLSIAGVHPPGLLPRRRSPPEP